MSDNYDIDDPEQARRYVADFAPRLLGKEATYVRTDSARLIHFRTMTDEDACWVALLLWEMEQMTRGRWEPGIDDGDGDGGC